MDVSWEHVVNFKQQVSSQDRYHSIFMSQLSGQIHLTVSIKWADRVFPGMGWWATWFLKAISSFTYGKTNARKRKGGVCHSVLS